MTEDDNEELDDRCPMCQARPIRTGGSPWLYPAWKCTNPSHAMWQQLSMAELVIPPEHRQSVGYRNTEHYLALKARIQQAHLDIINGTFKPEKSRSKSRRKG